MDYSERFTITVGLLTIVNVLGFLIEISFGVSQIHDFFMSPLFVALLFFMLWILAPIVPNYLNTKSEEQLRPHGILLMGAGLVLIYGTLLFFWLINK